MDISVSLAEMRYKFQEYLDYTDTKDLLTMLYHAEKGDLLHYGEQEVKMVTDTLTSRSKLKINCAYIELFEENVYDNRIWNEEFTPWCRKRFDLVQPDLFYDEEGNKKYLHDRFHIRKKPN